MDLTFKQVTTESESLKEVVFTGVEGCPEWTICCWDLKSRTVQSSYKGTSSKAQTLCVLSGEYVISADSCKPLIHVWPMNRRDHCLRIRSPGVVTALTVTPDGIYCAAATSYKIFVWLVSTGELLAVFDSNQVNNLIFTRNSKYLLSGGGIYVNVWSLTRILTVARTESRLVEPVFKLTHGNSVTGVKCGASTVVTSADRTVNQWSLRDGSLLLTTVLDSLVSTIEWSAKEDRIYAGAYDGEIYEIDLTNEKTIPKKFVYTRKEKKETAITIRKRDRRVTCLTLSLDGRILIAGSLKGKVYLWNTDTRHLVTSLSLNAGSLITSCLVARMPSNLEKPVHPVARFQESLAEEGEGKVKFLLERTQVDCPLNLEFSDEKFEKFVSKGFCLLDEFGKAPNKADQYARNWIKLTEQILSAQHDVLDQLFSNVGAGSAKYKRPPPGQVTFQPCPGESVELLSTLRAQFEKLCTVLSIMLCGFGLEYRVVVDFPLKYVIDLFCRTLSVTPPLLLKRPTPERINLSEMIHHLHVAVLGVVQHLMISVKSLLLPYAETINLLLLQCFAWSKINSSEYIKKKQAFSLLRSHVYEMLQTSLLFGLSGDSKSFESFFQTVASEAVTDARLLVVTQKKHQTKSEEAMSRANSYWLQVAKNRLRSKNQKSFLLGKSTAAVSTDQPMNEEEFLAIQTLSISAIRVLRRLIGSEGRFLSRSTLEMVNDLLKHLYSNAATVSHCRDAFHELVRSVVMVAASLPFTIELPLEVTTSGIHNDDTEELRQMYISSMRRGVRLVTVEEPTRAVESDGKFDQFVESMKRLPIVNVATEVTLQHSDLFNAKRKLPDVSIVDDADAADAAAAAADDDDVEPSEESLAKRKRLDIDDNLSVKLIETPEIQESPIAEELSSKDLLQPNNDAPHEDEMEEDMNTEMNCIRKTPENLESSPINENIAEKNVPTTTFQVDLRIEDDDEESDDDIKEMMRSFVCASPDRS